MHLPLGDGPPGHEVADALSRECAVLAAATAIVTTSAWARDLLLDRYPLRPDNVAVAEPGADPAELAPGTADGGQLLCVAAVTPHKGHDVLLAALTAVRELPWRCVLVGALDRDRDFVDLLRRRAYESGIGDRICFAGPRTGDELDLAYAAADVLVVPSLGETYGMVVTEALARGLPVIATAVGGLPHALGRTADGRRPGLLVAPGDAPALATALSNWLGDAELRSGPPHGCAGASRDVVRLAGDRRAGRAHTHRGRVVSSVVPSAGHGQPGLARVARVSRRRCPGNRFGREGPAPLADEPPGRGARSRLWHRLDGALARPAAFRARSTG